MGVYTKAIKMMKTIMASGNPQEALMQLVFSKNTDTSFKWDPSKSPRDNFSVMINVFVAEGRMTRERGDALLATDPTHLDIRELIHVEEGSDVDEVMDLMELQQLTKR